MKEMMMGRKRYEDEGNEERSDMRMGGNEDERRRI